MKPLLAALALTANGAKDETLDQLELVFGGTGIERVNGGLNALTTHLESLAGEVEKSEGTRTELVLDAANALFGLATSVGLVSLAAVLGSLYPVVTVGWARLLLDERLSRLQLVGVALTAVGAAAIAA